MKTIRLAMLASALVIAACSENRPGAESAWIREAPPNATALAGYVKLVNPTRNEMVLTGAESPDFGAIEIHRTIVKNQVARMQRESSVTIPAGETAAFEPGGHHLMLFRPKQPLMAGDEVDITLKFENGETLAVPFEVRRPE